MSKTNIAIFLTFMTHSLIRCQSINMALEIKQLTPVLQFTDGDVNEGLKWYNRNLQTACEDIEVIKAWIKSQRHLPVIPNDRQIFSFLMHNKFFIERAKEKIDMFYTIRHLIPEYFVGRVPSSKEMREIRELIWLAPLPKLTENKNRIWVCQVIHPNEPKFSVCNWFSFFLMIMELRTLIDFASSDEYIFDMSNATALMFAKFSPLDVKKLMTIIDKVYSNRMAAIHIVGLPSYGAAFINLFITFAKDKLKKRFVVHKNMEMPDKFYPKSLLPKDFGGDLASLQQLRRDFFKVLDDNEDYFQCMQKVKVDESLREKKLEDDDILGYHGNFKKLSVD